MGTQMSHKRPASDDRLDTNDAGSKHKHGLVTEEERKIVSAFSNSTTMHGFRHTSSGNKFRRGFWIVVCVGMVTGLIITIYLQTYTVLSYPTSTTDVTEFKNSMLFPSVTICNLNQFTTTFLEDHPFAKPMIASMSPISRHLNLVNWSDPIFDIMDKGNEVTQNNVTEVYDMPGILFSASHKLNETLVKCTIDNVLTDCNAIFQTIITDFGVCYTHNSYLNKSQNTPHVSTIPGNKYGLGITINTQQDLYALGENNDAAGMRVVLHAFSETPIVQDRGFNIGPGVSTYAALTRKKIRFLPAPYKAFEDVQCINVTTADFSHKLKYRDSYDYNQCILECQSEYVVKQCGCKGSYDYGPADYCNPKKYVTCILPQFDEFRKSGIRSCDCPFPCEHTTYESKLSAAAFPSKPVSDIVNRIFNTSYSLEYHRSNYAELKIFYDMFIQHTCQQNAVFTFENVLSTFGGQMGIFLGASLLSLIELLEFVLELAFVRCLVYLDAKKKKKVEPDSSKPS